MNDNAGCALMAACAMMLMIGAAIGVHIERKVVDQQCIERGYKKYNTESGKLEWVEPIKGD